jgi:hypothetical protein
VVILRKTIVVYLLILASVLSACAKAEVPTSAHSKSPKENIPGKNEKSHLSASQTYRLKGPVDASALPEGSSSLVFHAKVEHSYMVLETKGKFVKISDGELSGWIPEWYVDKENSGERSKQVDPYYMLVEKPIIYSIYPGERDPSGFELWPWKVVQVIKEYGDWVAVAIKTYDSPYFGDKWVPKTSLTPYNPAKAKEGILRNGAAVFDENGKETQDRPPESASIFIEGETNGRYRIIAAGGYQAFINKTDFTPNPFSPGMSDWILSAEKAQIYDLFVDDKNDELLRDLNPMDIFLFYVKASQNADFETLYALFNKEDGYEIPSKKSFLLDMDNDPEGVTRDKQNWQKREEVYLLQQRMDGKSALIILSLKEKTPRDEDAPVGEGEMGFGLSMNKMGIWKVNWQPMQ